MNAMWATLKENIYCTSKLNVIVSRPETYGKKGGSLDEEAYDNDPLVVQQMGNPFCKKIFKLNYPRAHFCELRIEDPSRNILEMIFHRASSSADSSKPQRNIERVVRVKNSIEVIERFEKHRARVMKKAMEQPNTHPRSTVDGNEMLLFYGTIMTCCSGKKRKDVSELCKNHSCRVCRTIQSKFETEDMKRNGIRLSKGTGEMTENSLNLMKVKNRRRAVIVCRTIAGRVTNNLDKLYYDEWDSFGSEGPTSNLQYLTLKKPSAVLPCFIILFR